MPDLDQEQLLRLLRSGAAMPGYAGAKTMGEAILPGITGYLTHDTPPPSMEANKEGKVPSGSNPYLPRALGEAGLLGLGGAGGLLESVASGVGGGLIGGAQAAENKGQAKAKTPPNMPTPSSTAAPGVPQDQPEVAGGGRPRFTADQLREIADLKKDITDLSARQQTEIQNVGRSRVGATAQNFQNQIAAKQARLDKLTGDMDAAQQLYDKQGQPLSMRNPAMVDALRGGAFGSAAAHGAARGLLKKNPMGTVGLGALEALGGAFAPTMMDLFQPPDTQAYQQAHHNLGSPDYWEHVVAPDVLYGGGVLSGIGHGIGRTVREGGEQAAQGIGKFVDWRRSLKGGPSPQPPGPPPFEGGLSDIDPNSPQAMVNVLRNDAKGRPHSYSLIGGGPSGRFARTPPPAND